MTSLARALLEELDPEDLAALAERLAPFLPTPGQPAVVAYTPKSLAAELGRSARSVRAAITRGELQAIKRGRGYVISAEAVAEWAQAPQPVVREIERRRPPPRPRTRPGPARRALFREPG